MFRGKTSGRTSEKHIERRNTPHSRIKVDAGVVWGMRSDRWNGSEAVEKIRDRNAQPLPMRASCEECLECQKYYGAVPDLARTYGVDSTHIPRNMKIDEKVV